MGQYITYTDKFFENNSLISKKTLAYVMPLEKSVDIDQEIDFEIAESLMKKREKNGKR